MKLTIGMAHFADFEGAYFTIQSLRSVNKKLMKDVEFIVVDNSPGTTHSQMLQGLIGNTQECAGARYIPMASPTGTSAPRNRIFQEAKGDVVLAMDCHVLLNYSSALESLLEYFQNEKNAKDIVTGPLVYDNMINRSTHFDDVWRGEMWGTWGQAWRCPCQANGLRFAISQNEKERTTVARLLSLGLEIQTECYYCGKQIPVLPWSGHELALEALGFKRLGYDENEDPFEIPGHGLGLYACKREAWQGFNKDARGFGGEELYIHEKFRRAGGRAMCLSKLAWIHRFGRVEGVKYPLQRWQKVRNYVLEFNELKWDLSPIHEHFVVSKLMTQDAWDKLISDPIGLENEPESCRTCNGGRPALEFTTVDEVFDKLHQTKRDLNEHMPKFKEYAEKVDRVTELSARRESTIAFFSAHPKKLTSYNTEVDATVRKVKDLCSDTNYSHVASIDIAEIEETDLLFIDTKHTYQRTKSELEKFAPKVTRYIIFHDTQIYGVNGEDGGPGILQALREFVRSKPEWSVIYHTQDQYGLTVLSRDEQDKPKRPNVVKMAVNFSKAMVKYVADGKKDVTSEQFEERLETCSLCPHRSNEHCTLCGCPIAEKARMRSQDCPISLWPALTILDSK